MRVINWETNLNNYIEKMSNYPFIWGESDCCHFAAGAIKSITNKEFKVNINNEFEALKYIKKNNSVESIADNYLKRKDKKYHTRGDIISAYIDKNNIALGVSMGDYGAFKTKDGITRKPISDILNCWGVD